jgi:CRISPR-associated protein Csb2
MPDNTNGTDKVLDGFIVVEPSADVVIEWEVDLDPAETDALRILADRLGYLGRAESVCEGRLLDDSEQSGNTTSFEARPATQGEGPTEALLVSNSPFDESALTATTTMVRRGRQIDPPGASRVRYLVPPVTKPLLVTHRPRPTAPTAVRFAMVGVALPSETLAVAICDRLRQAALSRFGELTGGGASRVLAGKSTDGQPMQGHGHAHYLAFTSDVRNWPRLDTLVVWAPDGLEGDELAALARITALRPLSRAADFREMSLGVEAVGDVSSIAPELVGQPGGHRVWESYTPFAPPRHPRKGQWMEWLEPEIRRELAVRGWPDGVVEQVQVAPLVETDARRLVSGHTLGAPAGGWMDFHRFRRSKGEGLRDARWSYGVRLVFPEPVGGQRGEPLSLGALSHFGLGLFLPAEGAPER